MKKEPKEAITPPSNLPVVGEMGIFQQQSVEGFASQPDLIDQLVISSPETSPCDLQMLADLLDNKPPNGDVGGGAQ